MFERSICATFSLFIAVACGGSEGGSTSGGSGDSGSGGPSGSSDGGSGASTSTGGDTPTSSGTPTTSNAASATNGSGGGQVSTTAETSTTGGTTGVDTTTDGSGGTTSDTTSSGGATATTDDGTTTTTDGSGGTGGSGNTTDCRVWLATDGNDGNDGSEAAPVASLLKAYDLMCPKPPDGTENGAECLGPAPRSICVKPGTYQITERLEFRKTRMGTANNRLILQGDPASTERPIFDFSGQERLSCGANPDNIGGFTINAHYVTMKNLVIRNANDNGILVQGTEGLVENVLVYGCADTGIQISSGGEYQGTGTNNTILNCDSHSNYDSQCDGENADGFAIKEGTGTGNAFIGCRAWNNTDDGFDLYAWTSPVRIENSWAFDQCATNEDSGSDCNGFKLGGDGVSATHQLENLIAVGNSRATGNGFTENSNPANLSCSGTCAAWGNKVDVDSVSGVGTSPIGGATVSTMAADSARNADGSLKSISEL
jgi:hypothetical protein